MKNYYENTTECIEKYNQVMDVICNYGRESTDEEDEFIQNHSMYFAHALIKDYPGSKAELCRIAGIINAACR